MAIQSVERCACCKSKNSRIDAPLTVGEMLIDDSYCGVCGVNWGVSRKKEPQSQKASRRHALESTVKGIRTYQR